MIRQYLDIKKEYKDAILFFRLGDFYEMFFDEAIEVSRILGLTLTKRNDVPMCGIPYHAYKVYVARLLRAGKKIAICEQVSEPLPGELTKREVTEVITAGIATEDDFLDAGSNNYLMAIYSPKKKGEEKTHSIAYIDVSLGAFYVSSFFAKDFEKELFKEIGRLNPSELLFQESLNENDAIIKRLDLECPNVLKTAFSDALFNGERAFEKLCRLFGTESLKAFGLEKDSECLPAAAIIIEYLENTSKNLLLHINSIKKIEEDEFLSIDYSTRKNLELTSNLNDGTSSYTLLEVINHTKTSMGTRLLKRRIEEPICNTAELEKRLEGVTALIKNERTFREIRSSLSLIADIQRLGGRIAMEKAGARDLLILSRSLKEALRLISLITKGMFGILSLTWDETNCISQIYQLLNSSINENVTSSTADIGIIKDGYDKEVDRLREVHNNAQKILEEYVLSERKKTGIQNLKIKYNKLIGYFLEVSKSHWEKAPEYFIKKRSISNSDRYTTEKLEKIVAEITGAEDALMKLEKSLFIEVRAKVAKENTTLQKLAEKVAELDVLQSFADVAKLNNWVCPHFTSDGSLKILGGRHPVVESHLPRGNSFQIAYLFLPT